jgi:hypothetical protein
LVVLRFNLKTLCLPGKCSTTSATLPALLNVSFLAWCGRTGKKNEGLAWAVEEWRNYMRCFCSVNPYQLDWGPNSWHCPSSFFLWP